MENPSKRLSLTVGPVVGSVTMSTARVLVETGSAAPRLTMVLKDTEGKAAEASVTLEDVPANRPVVFAVEGLVPGTEYAVTVLHGSSPMTQVPSKFRTFSEGGDGPMSVGLVSCNKVLISKQLKEQKEEDAWEVLKTQVEEGKINVILHLGDQVYADTDWDNLKDLKEDEFKAYRAEMEAKEESSVYSDCVALLRATPKEKWGDDDTQEKLRELYRSIYRETWQWPPTAYVLANSPNYMLPDDHEFRDDWGDTEEDYDKTSMTYTICAQGYHVYREYQAALRRDVAADKDFEDEHFIIPDFLPSCSTGLVAIDTRANSFLQDGYPYKEGATAPLLGEKQWEEITAALSANGSLARKQTLVVAVATPPWLLGTKTAELAKKFIDDFAGSWVTKRNAPELGRLGELLTAWKSGAEGREVVVVAGDVHYGQITDIKMKDKTVFQQFTASAIANTSLTSLQAATVLIITGISDTIHGQPDHGFEHTFQEHKRNFGVVSIPRGGGAPTLKLVTAGKESTVSKLFTPVASGKQHCPCSVQ